MEAFTSCSYNIFSRLNLGSLRFHSLLLTLNVFMALLHSVRACASRLGELTPDQGSQLRVKRDGGRVSSA